jgi:hypothetical protein
MQLSPLSIVIGSSHKEQFRLALKQRFARKTAELLRQNYWDAVTDYSVEELRSLALDGINRAEVYNLEYDRDVACFISLLFLVGWHFDEYPLFQAILADPALPHQEKISCLLEVAHDDDWITAADLSSSLVEAEGARN